MARNETDPQRRWAEDRIAELRAKRSEIDAEIKKHEDFITLLNVSSAALRESRARALGNGRAPRRLKKGASLSAYIQVALRDSGPSGFTIEEIVRRITALGRGQKGKTPFRTMVSGELSRQSKKPNSGIVKVAPGRYAHGNRMAVLVAEPAARG